MTENKEDIRPEIGEITKPEGIRVFAEAVKERLLSEDRGFDIGINEYRKNNGVVCLGLEFRTPGKSMVPIVYLEPFWEAFQNGTSMEKICAQILGCYEENADREPGFDVRDLGDFGKISSRICYRFVNAEKNREIFRGLPHRPFHDLMIIYYIPLAQDEEGIASTVVNDTLMEAWGTEEEELYKLAEKNTPGMFPPVLDILADILRELFPINAEEEAQHIPMLVGTNSAKMNGASVILYPDLLRSVSERFGGKSFYILPSSIHEVIFVPENYRTSADALLDLLRSVNKDAVAEKEFLSDNIYHYDADTGEPELIQSYGAEGCGGRRFHEGKFLTYGLAG